MGLRSGLLARQLRFTQTLGHFLDLRLCTGALSWWNNTIYAREEEKKKTQVYEVLNTFFLAYKVIVLAVKPNVLSIHMCAMMHAECNKGNKRIAYKINKN